MATATLVVLTGCPILQGPQQPSSPLKREALVAGLESRRIIIGQNVAHYEPHSNGSIGWIWMMWRSYDAILQIFQTKEQASIWFDYLHTHEHGEGCFGPGWACGVAPLPEGIVWGNIIIDTICLRQTQQVKGLLQEIYYGQISKPSHPFDSTVGATVEFLG